METTALTIRATSQCRAAAPAHGHRRSAAATVPRVGARGGRRPSCRLWALPAELSEILSPKLVPGSPADTGDVSSLIPVSALMLLFYFVSNWVVPEMLMKGLQPKAEDDAAGDASAASMPSLTQQAGDVAGGDDTSRKIGLKVKKKKRSKKAAIKL